MTTEVSTRHRRVRRILLWVLAWAVLTTIGTALHWGAWVAPRQSPPVETFLSEGVFRHLANFFGVLCTPGYMILVRLIATGASPLKAEALITGIAINGVSWIVWFLLLGLVLKVRRVLAGKPRATSDISAREPVQRSRRQLLVNTVFVGGAVAAGGSLAHGTLIAPWQLKVKRYRVAIKGLGREFDGLRIAFISDTHLGPRVPEDFIQSALDQAIALKPDLFLLGGDYVHNGEAQIGRAARQIATLVATGKPVIGVLGNHDWYAGGLLSRQTLTATGVHVVDNGRVFLLPGRTVSPVQPAGPCLCIAGVGDLWTDRVDAGAALDGVRPEIPRLLLSHNPDVATGTAMPASAVPIGERRVDLILSGHTHGGQVVFPFIGTPVLPIRSGPEYAYGLTQGPQCPVIITSGVGMSLVPIRVNCPPEVVEITLTAA